ncbi:MAG: DUF5129 domain-containing protein [Arthrobacter sp.]
MRSKNANRAERLREDIQIASRDLLRDAQWTDGTIAGIQRGGSFSGSGSSSGF